MSLLRFVNSSPFRSDWCGTYCTTVIVGCPMSAGRNSSGQTQSIASCQSHVNTNIHKLSTFLFFLTLFLSLIYIHFPHNFYNADTPRHTHTPPHTQTHTHLTHTHSLADHVVPASCQMVSFGQTGLLCSTCLQKMSTLTSYLKGHFAQIIQIIWPLKLWKNPQSKLTIMCFFATPALPSHLRPPPSPLCSGSFLFSSWWCPFFLSFYCVTDTLPRRTGVHEGRCVWGRRGAAVEWN